MTERNSYFDMLRGIAIVMVVAIHCFGLVYNAENFDGLAFVVRNLLNCAVPIFCVSSAFFLFPKDLSGKNYIAFLKKQVARVYLPMLFWSLGWLALDLHKGKAIGTGLVKLFTCDYSVYYFVAVIIQFYILLPLFQKIMKGNKVNLFILLSLLATTAYMAIYSYVIKGIYHVELPLLLYAGPILCHLVYFVLGNSLSNKKVYSVKLFLGIAVFSIIAMCIESHYLMGQSGFPVGLGIKASSVLYSLSVCVVLYSIRGYVKGRLSALLQTLGRFSFGIYLSHVYFIQVLHKVVNKCIAPPLQEHSSPLLNLFVWFVIVCIVVAMDYGCL